MFIELFNNLVQIVTENWEAFVALGGVAVFIPAVINVLKKLNVVGEGEADSISGLIQALLFLFFVGLRVFLPNLDVEVIDSVLEQVAGIIMFVLSFLAQFGISRVTYERVWKGRAGVLGFFHS